jgi:DNA polymerase
MSDLYCDLETFSPVNLFDFGTHAYAEEAEIMLFAYAMGDDEPTVLDFTEPNFYWQGTELSKMLKDPKITTMWQNGDMFDNIILKHVLGFELPPERMHDTQVQALAHGLPSSLDMLCGVFQLDEDTAKQKDGKRLINLFCKPRPANQKLRRATRETHPEQWKLFIEYAKHDILAMRELHKKMPMWNMEIPFEQRLWALDQTINKRGFAVDTEFAAKALAVTEKEKEIKNARLFELTEGLVEKGSQRERLLNYVTDTLGADIANLQAATIDKLLKDPQTAGDLREVLQIRKDVGGTSTSKYQTLLGAVSKDGRLRGTLKYNGASRTGRWSGRVFQPHNLPRPSLDQEVIDQGIEDIMNGCADILTDDIAALTTSTIRSCIVAPEGKKLVVSDLSNIEGRVAAWLAGEEWKLEAFRVFDGGTGHDLYKLSYARSFHVEPEDVDKKKRQIGKVQELALGYAGGVGAFCTFADAYEMNLDELADAAYELIPSKIKAAANSYWGYCLKEGRPTYDLDRRTFVTCDSLKRMWRDAHPAIVGYWDAMNCAAISAVADQGKVYEAGMIKFFAKGSWLRMVLPSGRALVYCNPYIKEGQLGYYGTNPLTKQWCRQRTYGGKLFENACQAVARDVMAVNMENIENLGYEIVLSVHDELITETPDDPGFYEGTLSRLLAANPAWAEGLPLAASGFEAYRYRKD